MENAERTEARRCLACGSEGGVLFARATDVEYRTTDESFAYYRCAACDVLFIDPVPLSRLSEIYPRNYYSYAPPGSSLVAGIKERLDTRVFRRLLRDVPGDELRVLDVGGGAGWQLSSVRSADPRVKHTHVVDLDEGAEQLAIENGHTYFCGRIEDYETDSKFDVVLLLNLIEHVAAPTAVLERVRRLLSPHGVVLVKTPNYDALDARLFRNQSWAGYHCPRHWVLFTKESFAALAAKSGLSVRAFAYTQGAPFWTASVLAWLAARRLVTITQNSPVVEHPLFGALSAGFAAFDFARSPFAKTSQMFFTLGRS